QRLSHVYPLRHKMRQGDPSAKFVKQKIALDDDLRRRPGIGPAQQSNHFVGKKGRPDAEGEEDRCAEPHGGISHTHESQKPDHLFRLEKSEDSAKFFSQIRWMNVQDGTSVAPRLVVKSVNPVTLVAPNLA